MRSGMSADRRLLFLKLKMRLSAEKPLRPPPLQSCFFIPSSSF
jgi:hypothetical protein